MRKAANRADPDSFFVEDEKSTNAYDPAWTEFIVQCWDDLTRASECALQNCWLRVSSECTNEAEPYIISLALAEEATWHGEDDTSWMGKIVEGTCTLRFSAHTI